MADLLLELFSEEIPAGMQKRACADLQKIVTNGLVEAGLTYGSAGTFATPRRLCLTIDGCTYAAAHGFDPKARNVVAGWNVPAPTSMS